MAGLQGAVPDREQLCGHLKHHPAGSHRSLSVPRQGDLTTVWLLTFLHLLLLSRPILAPHFGVVHVLHCNSFENNMKTLCFNLKLFKLPLEKEGQVGGPILAQEEIKTIFGSIPDIYEVHTRIKVLYPSRATFVWSHNYAARF